MDAVVATALWLLERVCMSELLEGFRLLDRAALRARIIAAICGQCHHCISLPECSKLLAVAGGPVLQCMLSTDSAGDILLVLTWDDIARCHMSYSYLVARLLPSADCTTDATCCRCYDKFGLALFLQVTFWSGTALLDSWIVSRLYNICNMLQMLQMLH